MYDRNMLNDKHRDRSNSRGDTSPSGAYAAAGGGMSMAVKQQQKSLAEQLHRLQALCKGEEMLAKYDSDDEPGSLVGSKIKVKWNQEYYDGRCTHAGLKVLSDTFDYQSFTHESDEVAPCFCEYFLG